MSSSVCQGFQSCLEPSVIEPRALKLKLTQSKSSFSQPSGSNSKPIVSHFETQIESQNEQNKNELNDVISNKEADIGGWSFLQALSNKSNAETEKIYVHPLAKRSCSKLSKQSLEMCTESLGSETGSDVSDTGCDDFSSLSVKSEKFPTRQSSSKLSEIWTAKRLNRSHSFPPPLTSISVSTGLQVSRRREGGRLVLEAVTTSSRRTCFHAERSDGRLRLRLFNDSPPSYDNDAEEEEEEDEEEEEKEKEEEVEEAVMSFEAEEQVVEVDGVENEDEDEDEVYDEENGEMGEEMDEIRGNVGGEMGINKLSRPSRCKEGGRENRGLMNWKPFLVAT